MAPALIDDALSANDSIRYGRILTARGRAELATGKYMAGLESIDRGQTEAALAGKVDVMSVHSPSTAQTRQLVSREVIWAMKPGAILVNTSRGAVVDEAALIEALQTGRLGGAGLDVYDPEPPSPDNPLFQMEQVALTPHLASFTDEGRRRMGLMAVEDTLRVLRGEKPLNLANPEVWEHRRAGAS